jgi:hypothetical protein
LKVNLKITIKESISKDDLLNLIKEIDIEDPIIDIFDEERQKKILGKLYKNKISFQNDRLSPVYTGLFSKFKDTLKDIENKCVLILGASGTGKFFKLYKVKHLQFNKKHKKHI